MIGGKRHMFERALWITAAKAVPATLSIAALGQGVSYINGVRVPDSYRPLPRL